jgi:hypothetical protein
MRHLRWDFTRKRAGKVGILTGRFSAIRGSVLGRSTVAGSLPSSGKAGGSSKWWSTAQSGQTSVVELREDHCSVGSV